MSFDPYRANYGIGETTGVTGHALLLRHPHSSKLRHITAGEDLGLGAANRYPLRSIDEGIFPLKLVGGSAFEMTAGDYLLYLGILLNPTYNTHACTYFRDGVAKLPVGSIDIAAHQLVSCETSGGGTDGDVVPQSDLEPAIYRADAIVAANTNIDIGETINQILSAKLLTSATGLAAPLTVVTAAPGAGEIRWIDRDTVELGDALADGDQVLIYGAENEHHSRHTVGEALTGGLARVSATDYDLVEVDLI